MRSVKSRNLALIGLTVFIGVCQVAMARSGGGGRSAIRRGTSNYAPASVECVTPDETFFTGPTVIADLADGVSSDGRGPYIQGTDGVVQSRVANAAALSIYSKDSVKKTRTLTVNMNYPVPGGAGVPFGIVTDEQMGSGGGLHTQRYYPRDTAQNMNKL